MDRPCPSSPSGSTRAWTSSATGSPGSGCPRASTRICGSRSGVPQSRATSAHSPRCSRASPGRASTRATTATSTTCARILTVLWKLGVRGWIDYKRDCDTARGLYGRGALYWQAPPGTVAVEARVPQRSPGTRDSEREPRPSAIVDGERRPRADILSAGLTPWASPTPTPHPGTHTARDLVEGFPGSTDCIDAHLDDPSSRRCQPTLTPLRL